MLSLNDACRQAAAYRRAVDDPRRLPGPGLGGLIADIQESATGLLVYPLSGNQYENRRRVADVLFGALMAAGMLGIEDVDGALAGRITELKKDIGF